MWVRFPPSAFVYFSRVGFVFAPLATKDAKWRIGWIRFARGSTRVVGRCDEPVIVPPRPHGDETDVAFAASALTDGGLVRLYYSVADQFMVRATLRPH